jgi:hypothetical protein
MVRQAIQGKNRVVENALQVEALVSMIDYIVPEVEAIDKIALFFLLACRAMLQQRACAAGRRCAHCGAALNPDPVRNGG